MSWFTSAINSTLGKKVLMALTGLFLVTFLIVHLIGNLQLLAGDGGKAFNIYAKFMTTNPLIKTTSYLLYASFLAHIIWAILLTITNRNSRPVGYANANKSGSWSSRNMGILGTIIFIFLDNHMRNFWYEKHWGSINTVTNEGSVYKDLFAVVDFSFQNLLYVALYVVAMIGLMFHLYHGFKSAFQTLGLNHPKYNNLIQGLGYGIAIVIPALFAAIPVIMYLK